MMVGIIGIIIVIFLILKFKLISNKYVATILRYVMYSLLIAFGLEYGLFQYRHYESLFFQDSRNVNYTFSQGIQCQDDCEVIDKDNAYLEISNLDSQVYNLYLDINSSDIINYKVFLKDEANKLYFDAGNRSYTKDILPSRYLRIHASGKTDSVKLVLNVPNSFSFNVNKISVNTKVPLIVNNIRLVLVFIGAFLIFMVNPKNVIYEIKFNHRLSKYLVLAVIIVMSLGIYKVTTYNTFLNSIVDKVSNQSQYKNLAEALTHKRFDLKLEVTPELKELDNPYDTYYRDSVLQVHKDYFWDYAFYNNKYYSYFGIVPCLLIYLPFYAITGNHVANNIALSITCSLFVAGVFYFVYQLLNKYFKNTSLIWYGLISVFLIFSSNLMLAIGCDNFYYIPIFMALAFCLLGLGFYIKATTYEEINCKYLFLGSTCMALIAGCRPQVLMALGLVPIILWDSIFKKRELFSAKTIKETVVTILPYIVVAAFLMYYNYKRFGNIFDFGAAYNLTTNDMTKRGFEFDRIFTGIYYYLFHPGYFTPVFPFLKTHPVSTTYLGKTIYEQVYGGFFFSNLICLLSLFIFKFREKIANKTLFYLSLAAVIGGFVIILADTQMAGILPRYISDFAIFFSIPTVIIILSLIKEGDFKYSKLLVTLIVVSLIFNCLAYFQAEYLFFGNPYLLQKLTYLFSFWL